MHRSSRSLSFGFYYARTNLECGVLVDVIFERRLYLPLVGVCMSFPFFVDFLREKLKSDSAFLVRPGATPLSFASHRRHYPKELCMER